MSDAFPDIFATSPSGKEPDAILVVRVTTSYWSDRSGGHMRKKVGFMKRLSKGFNLLDEDFGNIGADEVIPRILNLHDVEDGLYVVHTANEERDWETGNVEEYDYRLYPYTP
jgi:hypothetical protein